MNHTKTPLAPVRAVKPKGWKLAWSTVAQNRLWVLLLTVLGSASSVVYPHPPLVSFATVAGTTLKPTQAVKAISIIWLVNQIWGYTLRNYPQTTDSFVWGLIMGLGTLLVTLLATIKPRFSRERMGGHFLWLGTALIAGFVLFESLILLFGTLLGNEHSITLSILAHLFLKEMIWTISLALGHLVWVRCVGSTKFLSN
ncbi:hypothetical protein [Allocoleopsis franciscana]|uniref:Uncharacterized protein n=1 Tax=Allocoleopsis franciscana PCC 7113 TaxID=1173027 RepID=K9WG96_9CYAN|nr:hypothetical protein [Allocoleopsis franciscana]AFZ18799.1 hypothetical protein Mic7113_3031 [Allocoleopsis franciscana PCC 7113]